MVATQLQQDYSKGYSRECLTIHETLFCDIRSLDGT
jgi:hypothetical protein